MKTQLESMITRVEGIFHSSNSYRWSRRDRRFESTGKLGRIPPDRFWVLRCVLYVVCVTRLQEPQAAQERGKEGRHAALAMGQRPQRPYTFPRLVTHSATTAKAAHSSWSALVRARLGCVGMIFAQIRFLPVCAPLGSM